MHLAKADFLDMTRLPCKARGTSTIFREKAEKDVQAPTFRHQLPCTALVRYYCIFCEMLQQAGADKQLQKNKCTCNSCRVPGTVPTNHFKRKKRLIISCPIFCHTEVFTICDAM